MVNEFSRRGTTVSVTPGTPLFLKLRMLLGHCDLRIYVTETAYIDIGRGSLDAVKYVEFVIPEYAGCIGRVGQFCNFAQSCELFGGGEHRNNQPVNIVFTTVPAFASITQKYGIESLRPAIHEPFVIGNGVVVSAGAKVMPGARIGDGALIAADGVVTGEIEAFSIAAGLPAKHIKYRLDEETRKAMSAVRWWDFDTVYMGNNLDTLQKLAVDTTAKHIYRRATPAVILKILNAKQPDAQIQVLGFIDNGESKPMSAAPAKVINYIKQISGPGPFHWVPDIWNID